MAPRETKTPLQVPVIVTDKMMSDEQIGKSAVEIRENTKNMMKVQEDTYEEVKGGMQEIKEGLKELKEERINDVKRELEKERDEARRLREERDALGKCLKDTQVLVSNAEARASRAEQQLKEEKSDHERFRLAAEEAQREALRAARNREEQRDLEASTMLQAQLQHKQLCVEDLEAKNGALKARQCQVEKQLDDKSAECEVLHEQVRARDLEVNQKKLEYAKLREQFEHSELQVAALTQEKCDVEARLCDVNGRYQSLEIEYRTLQEQRRNQEVQQQQQEYSFGAREAQLLQREEEMLERVREISTREQRLAVREQRAHEAELAVRNLDRCQEDLQRQRADIQRQQADYEQQVQEREQQFERERQEFEQQMKEGRERHRKYGDSDKENRALKQTVQDQKTALFDLQDQIKREQTVATFITPGEWIKMAKKLEPETAAQELSTIKIRHTNLEIELKEVRWHNEVMRKHLPLAARDAVSKELHAQPLPTVCLDDDTL